MWAFGGFLSRENKAAFDTWWRGTFTHNPALSFPEGGQVWDYYFHPGTPGFSHWGDSVPHYTPPIDNSAPFVHTVQSMAVKHLVTILIDRGFPVLLNGDTGSGKTSVLNQLLKTYCTPCVSEARLLHVYCNQLTDAGVVWRQLRDNLEWRWGRNYTPQACRRLVCFIDDLHNAQVREGGKEGGGEGREACNLNSISPCHLTILCLLPPPPLPSPPLPVHPLTS